MRANKSKLILVIDDSADNRALLEILFEAQGWKVYGAGNGAEALLLLRELSRLPDLILLDLQMPVMDGTQFRREQRRDERIKNIPILVMSATDNDSAVQEIAPVGRINKPLRVSSLVERVSAFL